MEDLSPSLSAAEKYLQIRRTLQKRTEYLEKAIMTLLKEPPVPGHSQDTIAVSRESMVYVLERAKDAVEIAEALNELINDHNLGQMKAPTPRLLSDED